MAQVTSTEAFEFIKEQKIDLEDTPLNGLLFNNIYIPEEIIENIFIYLSPSDILECSLVCKRWFNIARSNALWRTMYNIREYPKKAKRLPWFVFYSYLATNNFKNLIHNGNGQEGFKHWSIVQCGGVKFRIEHNPLPEGIPELKGYKCCFATIPFRTGIGMKYQTIDLARKPLLKQIIKKYKPTLYASEWCSGHFQSGGLHRLTIICNTNRGQRDPRINDNIFYPNLELHLVVAAPDAHFALGDIWAERTWRQVQIVDKEYPDDVQKIFFCREVRDLNLWHGRDKLTRMAGGILRFDFDSILPTCDADVNGNPDISI